MEELLLQTKLTPPLAHQKEVARPHLLARLNEYLMHLESFSRKLTLVSAPAGYGKTSLTVDWLRNSQVPYAWLSLDEGDNDPLRFLAYVIAALHQVYKDVGSGPQGMLAAPQPPPAEAVLTALINEIEDRRACLMLVLDDYHTIQAEPIHQQVTFLLEHQPEYLHLVILSREDPPLPLHRLRARRQMLEIRQDDLRFSPGETSDFLSKVMSIELNQADVEALARRTEGWVAGLQLAGLSLRGHPDTHSFVQSFTGSNRYVLDYLFEEVFQQQPSEVQSFLLSTSILNRLTPSLCNALTGRSDGRLQIEALEKANLFLFPVDSERRWYRYHRLFADLLRHQLRLIGEPPERSLHARASQWYWENGLFAEAVQHALAAEEWDLAAKLIEASSDALLKRGEVATLNSWFAKLPAEVILAKTQRCITYAWVLMLASQYESAEKILQHAEQSTQREPVLSGEVAAAQAYLAQTQGDGRRMVELSHKALALLPEDNLTSRGMVSLNLGLAYWHMGRLTEAQKALEEAYTATRKSGNFYGEITARVFLGRTQAVRGQLRQAVTWYQDVIRQSGETSVFPITYLDLCALHYEWNELETASHHLSQGLEASQRSGNLEFLIAAYMLQARLNLAQGDPAGASKALQQIQHLEQTHEVPARTQARSADLQVQFALWQNDLETARRLASQLAPAVNAHPFYRYLGLTPARLLLAMGQRTKAAEQLQSAAETAARNDWGYGLMAVRVLQALAAETSNTALKYLGEALTFAQPEGYIRTFSDIGKPLAPLLQEAAHRNLQPIYARKILAVIEGERPAVPATPGLVEKLSERELEILRLVAAGLSNREIAGQLVISLGTVKTHIHNIYGKLEVRNRAQAITRAQELELL